MKSVARTPGLALKIALVRLFQGLQVRVGMPGLVGLAFIAVSLSVLALAWRQHRASELDGRTAAQLTTSESVLPQKPAAPIKSDSTDEPLTLPPATAVPTLLTRIEQAAMAQGLGWPQADYRFNAATDDAPASLELRCKLKGPYLNIRRFVTTLLQDAPTLTLREFSLNRASSDSADVEAKLSIVVFLASGTVTPVEEAR
jgi:hypothetical protein